MFPATPDGTNNQRLGQGTTGAHTYICRLTGTVRVTIGDYDAIVLPGGQSIPTCCAPQDGVALIKGFADAGSKTRGAICHGPLAADRVQVHLKARCYFHGLYCATDVKRKPLRITRNSEVVW